MGITSLRACGLKVGQLQDINSKPALQLTNYFCICLEVFEFLVNGINGSLLGFLGVNNEWSE